jgi:SAM-dependent methyltransferase
MTIPKTLNVGSGKDFKEDCINLDKDNMWKPDIVHNLNYPFRADEKMLFNTLRFGTIEFKGGVFEKIIANDVLEHVTNLTVCMKSCLDLLEVGGVMEIYVPYDLSLGAWQDPTHVRAFNQNSWLYYCAWSWYLGWEKERFEMTKIEFKLSTTGQGFKTQGWHIEEILNVPRAVDGMKVELKKIIAHNQTKGGQNGRATF